VTLFISQISGAFPLQVGQILMNIANAPYNLGTQPYFADPSVVQVTYQAIGAGIGDALLDAAVNGYPNNPIVLIGVSDTFVLPDGEPITNEAGWTSWDNAPQLPGPGDVTRTFIDITGCSGIGYCVCAAGGTPTSFPLNVCLVHELSHALQLLNGTFNPINPEALTIAQENTFRAQKGILPLRDPNNYGNPSCSGCGKC
jgi:hypothetical protein